MPLHLHKSNRWTFLLRLSRRDWRDTNRVKKQTILNISHWSPERLLALKTNLKTWRNCRGTSGERPAAEAILNMFEDRDFGANPWMLPSLMQLLHYELAAPS